MEWMNSWFRCLANSVRCDYRFTWTIIYVLIWFCCRFWFERLLNVWLASQFRVFAQTMQTMNAQRMNAFFDKPIVCSRRLLFFLTADAYERQCSSNSVIVPIVHRLLVFSVLNLPNCRSIDAFPRENSQTRTRFIPDWSHFEVNHTSIALYLPGT